MMDIVHSQTAENYKTALLINANKCDTLAQGTRLRPLNEFYGNHGKFQPIGADGP